MRKINGFNVEVLGDPHLGKRFENGVPLERRGEREESQWEDFKSSLFVEGADVHVCVGDIFDKFIVPNEVLLRVADLYRKASRFRPDTTFVLMRGNHDCSRDQDRRSSFDVLRELLYEESHIHVIEVPVVLDFGGDGPYLAFLPWMPFRSAAEAVSDLGGGKVDAAFGHWDMDSFGSEQPNLVPVNELKEITNLAITGHVHTPETRSYGDLTVEVVGSMQPYSHGEDPDGKRYVSLTPEEIAKRDDLRDKCVRVLLQPDEEIPEVDCSQLSIKRQKAEEEAPDLSIDASKGMDFQGMFDKALTELDADVAKEIKDLFDQERTD